MFGNLAKGMVFRSAVFIGMASLASMLTACGGGGGGADTSTSTPSSVTLATGKFVDSPVEGLRYVSGNQTGYTNANGEFTYEVGQQVTFYVGNISFSAAGGARITPLTVFQTTDFSDTRVVNLARLLQTLDSDGVPGNGITITNSAHTAAAALSVDFSSPTFDAEVGSLVASGGGSASLVSTQDAVSHMQDQLSIVGNWYVDDVAGSSRVVLTFFSDNTYMLAEYGPDDQSGWSGMESGTYAWNASTGAFSATPSVDTNGDWGLSHHAGTLAIQIEGSTMTFTEDSVQVASFTRVPNESGSIVGGWYAEDVEGSSRVAMTFFSDNTYMLAEYGPEDPNRSGWNGMESGTYTWNSSTGAFSATTNVDTSGDWGLSHPQGSLTVQINGNSMTLTDSVSGGITTTRILP